MKVRVYNTINRHSQTAQCRNKLLQHWKETASNSHPAHFPQPSEEALDAERKHFPLNTFKCHGKVLSYGTEGDDGELYTVAIVHMDDNSVDTISLDRLEVVT